MTLKTLYKVNPFPLFKPKTTIRYIVYIHCLFHIFVEVCNIYYSCTCLLFMKTRDWMIELLTEDNLTLTDLKPKQKASRYKSATY